MKQEKIWDNIAPEWYEFKTKPAHHVQEFLKNKTGNILDLGGGAGRHLQKIGSDNNSSAPKALTGGKGRESRTKIKNGKMYLIDFSEKMIKLAKKKAKKEKINAEFNVASLDKLPFKDNFFDSAIAVASIHCIPKEKQKQTIKELFRVLKPNAQAEICVWNKKTKRFKNSPKERFVGWREKGKRYYYLFEPREIYKLFKDAGFKIISKEEPRRMIIFVVEKP